MNLARRITAVLVTFAVVGSIAGLPALPGSVSPAVADGTPDVQLVRSVEATTLYGTPVAITLTATAPAAPPEDGFNLTFSDILPEGATISSSTFPVTQQIPQPDGTTLVIWANVADLLAGATVDLGYTFTYPDYTAPDPDYDVGDIFQGTAHAYASTDPNAIPNPDLVADPDGGIWTDFNGSAEATSSTQLVPFTVEKREIPSPEGELLRGAHDHPTVYEIVITNNAIAPTSTVSLVDYLPASLEFLGCTAADNSSGPEYPGAPPLGANFPALVGCDPGYTATTIQAVGIPGVPDGVYTQVTWSLADLAPAAVITLQYAATIPLHANVFPGPLDATADLDNNTGPEAADEQAVTNYAAATGDYEGGVGGTFTVTDSTTVSAEDVRIVKSVDTDVITHGQTSLWTLDIDASEYVISTGSIVVTDSIPDGLDFDPSSSSFPVTSVTPEADGTITVVWTLPPILAADPTATITYETTTRTTYRATGEPVSAKDSWINTVDLQTSTDLMTGPDGTGTRVVAVVVDASEAGQTAEDIAIDKTVGEPVGGSCTDPGVTWSDGAGLEFHPGDTVCFRLDVDFPNELDTVDTVIGDYLPPGFSYVSQADNTPTHTFAPGAFTFSIDPDGSVLSWAKDAVVVGDYFSVILTTEITEPAEAQTVDISGNLMKVRFQNSAGATFQLRDLAEVALAAPLLTLDKERTTPAVAEASDPVAYDITVMNAGAEPATATEVWDVLPAGWTCAEIDVISDGGVCSAGVIVWTGLTIPAEGSLVLTVTGTLPATAAPGDVFENHAGVREYENATNTGGVFTYIPSDNIDPGVPSGTWNTIPADDVAEVTVEDATLVKTASTQITEAGNLGPNQATIGELVDFVLTATIPAGSTLYGSPAITDVLGARYEIVGTPQYQVDTDGPGGAAPGAPVNANVAGQTVSVPLGPVDGGDPATYVNGPGSGDDIVTLAITVRVRDVASAVRGANIPNTGALTWLNGTGETRSATSNAPIVVVEPNLVISKSSDDVDGVIQPDQVIQFTLGLTNTGSNVSVAHQVVVTDEVPEELIPLGPGDVAAGDGDTLVGGGVWDLDTRTITYPAVATVVPGATPSFLYRARVVNPVVTSGGILNTADVVGSSIAGTATGERDSTSPNGGLGSGYTSHAELELDAPAFTLDKIVAPTERTIGEKAVYELTIGIPAGVFAFDVTIIDTLPAGVGYSDIEGITATCLEGAVACAPAIPVTLVPADADEDDAQIAFDLGDIAASAEARIITISYTAVVLTTALPGDADNSATLYFNETNLVAGPPVTVPPPGDFDVEGPEDDAEIEVVRPVLGIAKTVDGVASTRALPGDVLNYGITVSNTGDSPAYDVVVTDTPDSRLTDYTPGSMPGVTPLDTDPSDGTLSWTIAGPIPAGGSVSFDYSLTIPAGLTVAAEVVGAEIVNTVDIPSYLGVPLTDQDPTVEYADYDDVIPDSAQVELDLASIGDRVWFDLDGDGVQDAGEPGIAGVEIEVRYEGPDGTIGTPDDEVHLATTDADGGYLVDRLPGGTYRVTVDLATVPVGMTATFDRDGGLDSVWNGELLEGEAQRDTDFGFTGTGSVGDLVWFDQDADGVLDGAETGIGGVPVTVLWAGVDGLLDTADDVSYPTVTDAAGGYLVTGLPAGAYRVTLGALPAGYVVVTDPDGVDDGVNEFALAVAEDRLDRDFGLAGSGAIGDLVWFDRDGDGIRDLDGTEPGIVGAELELIWFGVDGVEGGGDDATFLTTTDALGIYAFPNLLPGGYRVSVIGSLPDAADNSYDLDGDLDGTVVLATPLGVGETRNTLDFGYHAEAVLGDRVWLDRDASGTQEADEPGIPGVDIRVTWFGLDGVEGGGDDVVVTTTTDATGTWSVNDLDYGNYRVEVIGGIAAGLTQTFDSDGLGTPASSETSLSEVAPIDLAQDFGYAGARSVGDLVWFDLDGDGIVTAGEPGIDGVTVELTWWGLDGVEGGGDDIVLTTVTAGGGLYSFPGVPEGEYSIRVLTATLPAGLTPSFDAEGATDGIATFTLGGTDRLDLDFGFTGTGSIGDLVWLDRNGDGVVDRPADNPDLEPGIPDTEVTLLWAGPDDTFGTPDDVTWTTTTDATGAYLFERLPEGDFRVTLGVLPAGLVSTADPDGGVAGQSELSLVAGESNLDQDFGYAGTASVGDLIWLDFDGDDTPDPTEPGVPGIPVTVRHAGIDGILGSDDDLLTVVVTDALGAWSVDGLPPGEIEVSYDPSDLPAGYSPSTDRDGGDFFETTLTLGAGDAIEDVDFGVVGDASLGGVVFDDRNANGVRDPGEPGIPGVDLTVVWAGPSGNTILLVTTDADGEWLLERLPAGEYTVTVDPDTVPDGFRPSTLQTLAVTLSVGEFEFVVFGETTVPLAVTGATPLVGVLAALLLLSTGFLVAVAGRLRRDRIAAG